MKWLLNTVLALGIVFFVKGNVLMAGVAPKPVPTPPAVPEIDAGIMASGLILLGGGVFLLNRIFRRAK